MAEIVLETEGLTKYYGTKPALDHLDLKLPRGSICGFLGRNGSGKTTAIKLMLGLLNPTAGSARIFGCDSRDLTPSVRQRIGYVTEGHHLYRWMTIGALESFQRAFFPGRWDDSLFADMLEYFELGRKQKIKHLSNGQRAQVSLTLALAPNPELLIMDDPTLGLDAAIRRQFLEGMIQLIMRQGRTILFSSHILGDVERVSDRIVVLDKGVCRADCRLDEFRSAVRKVKFSFADSPPAEININGLLHFNRDGNEIEAVLIGTGDEMINQWAAENRAIRHDVLQMSLEDQFIEYTAPANHKKMFQWENAL